LALIIPALILGVPADPATSPWSVLPAQGWSGGTLPRLMGAAWVHATARHQHLNLLAAALIALLGWAWRAPWRAALAWALAWPATHLLLLLDPRLGWYVGASGMLHAGLAVLLVGRWRHQPRLVALIGVALALKVLLDVAAGTPLATRSGLDVAMVPLSHVFGILAGVAIAGLHQSRICHHAHI
jgi:hypothetical protein